MSKRRFVIISYPRTGSTFLTLKLNSADSVNCYSEVFHHDTDAFNRSFYRDDFTLHKKTWLGKRSLGLDSLFKLKDKDYKTFLDLLYSSSDNAVGFKIFPGQKDEAMRHLIDDRNVKKIFLIREDMLRNFVSYKLAMTTGKWDRMPGQQAELQQVLIDADEFLEYADTKMDAIESLQKSCVDQGQSILNLSYEDITKELPVSEIEDFLEIGLDGMEQEVERKKQNPFSLDQMVKNFDELAQKLEGTRWQQFLEEK